MVLFDYNTIQALEGEFTRIAFQLFRDGRLSSDPFICDRRIRGWCGCSPTVIAKLWNLLERGNLHELASKDRLLWGLHLLKGYTDEITAAAFCGSVDECTFRKWAWYFIEEISYLENEVVRINSLSVTKVLDFLTLLKDPLEQQKERRYWKHMSCVRQWCRFPSEREEIAEW